MNPIIHHITQLLGAKPYVNTTPRAGITRWVEPYIKFDAGDVLGIDITTRCTNEFPNGRVFVTKADYERFRDDLSAASLRRHADDIISGKGNWR